MAQRIPSDEDRLVNQHDSAKAAVEQDIHSEVALTAEQKALRERAHIEDMAAQVKDKAVADVREAERLSERRKRLARVVQVIDFLFTILYVMLGLRLALELMAANEDSGFVELVNGATQPFYAFFHNVVASPTVEGGHTLALPVLVALGAYALLHWGVRSLAKLIVYRQSEI
jgi:hypothetical protein